SLQFNLQQRAQALDYLTRRLISPLDKIAQQQLQLTQIQNRLKTLAQQQLMYKQQHLLRLSQNLQHLNPQAVLTRGYAFV
ncbi:MAG: exodeoxyribonuclease VII large subunit, partial [Methylotenera sp.]